MKKIYDEFIKQSKGEGHTPYWIYDNFRGYIKFGKLTLQQDAIVKEIKALRKNENIDKTTQEEVVIQVKSSEDYLKYSSKKIAEMIAKGEIRDMKSFELTCQDMKLEPKEILSKCDSIFKKSNVGKTVKQTFKEYDFLDSKIQF